MLHINETNHIQVIKGPTLDHTSYSVAILNLCPGLLANAMLISESIFRLHPPTSYRANFSTTFDILALIDISRNNENVIRMLK